MYFTITTITTVGYGDFSAHTFLEKFICIFIMLTGVIGFASASGAVTNYIDQMDQKSAIMEEKMSMLEKLFEEHHLP